MADIWPRDLATDRQGRIRLAHPEIKICTAQAANPEC
jgi:hypothetical protein